MLFLPLELTHVKGPSINFPTWAIIIGNQIVSSIRRPVAASLARLFVCAPRRTTCPSNSCGWRRRPARWTDGAPAVGQTARDDAHLGLSRLRLQQATTGIGSGSAKVKAAAPCVNSTSAPADGARIRHRRHFNSMKIV